MNKTLFLVLPLLILSWPVSYGQGRESVKQLDEWTFYGQGTKLLEGHGQYLIKENPDASKGVGLISPESYSTNVVMRYKVMALTPATVLVAILSASDRGESSQLSLPENYDGSIKFWSGGCDNYFFAFHNAAHNYPPFVRRFDDKKVMLDVDKKNRMHVGKYYSIEAGRKDNKIWLKIDGKTVLKYVDTKPYASGHLGLRIRGTGGEYAACLIKDLEIISD
jgi:hypothetical protein